MGRRKSVKGVDAVLATAAGAGLRLHALGPFRQAWPAGQVRPDHRSVGGSATCHNGRCGHFGTVTPRRTVTAAAGTPPRTMPRPVYVCKVSDTYACTSTGPYKAASRP
jgi:hypothetical protein